MDAGQRSWHTFGEEFVKLPGIGESAYRFVKRKQVQQLIDDPFHVSAWNEWCRWKRFGLPHGGAGWLSERLLWIQCIEIIDEEQTIAHRARADNGKRQHGVS